MCPDEVKLTPVKDVVEISVFPYFLLGTFTIIAVIITMIIIIIIRIIMMMKYESDLRSSEHCLSSSKNKT